jgi:hypothetical protein
MARRFRFSAIDEEVNASEVMFQEFKNWKSRSPLLGRFNEGDSIKTAALGVIVLFGIGYSLVLSIRMVTDVANLLWASPASGIEPLLFTFP